MDPGETTRTLPGTRLLRFGLVALDPSDLGLEGSSPVEICRRADVLLDLRRFDEALGTVRSALARHPESCDLWIRASIAHLGARSPGEAVAAAERAVAAVRRLIADCGGPQRLSDCGVQESDLAALARDGFGRGNRATNPRIATEEDVAAIYRAAL